MPSRSESRSAKGKTKETKTTSLDVNLDERLSSIEQKLSSLPAIASKIDALVEMMANGGAADATTSTTPAWTKEDRSVKKGDSASPEAPLLQTMMNYSDDSSDEDDDANRYAQERASDKDLDKDEESAVSVLVESDTGMINPHNK